jgi:hypothetical protein
MTSFENATYFVILQDSTRIKVFDEQVMRNWMSKIDRLSIGTFNYLF